MKVTSEEFASLLEESLIQYADETCKIVKMDINKVAEESLKVLKENAPEDKGKYKKALAKKKSYEGATDIRFTLYVKSPEYRKTHLLERGHAKRNGGRTKAIPHFEKAEEYADENLVNTIMSDLKK